MSAIAADDRREDAPPMHVAPAHGLPVRHLGLYAACKNTIDATLAAVLLVLTAPLILGAMLVIRLTSRGPALYTQTRLGKYGQPFVIYKLRTMVYQCESLTGACWSTANDPRVTALGWVLRRLHIDELPQLWNVLRGEMSLIGPRPERPEFVPQLEQAIRHYRDRLLVKPGITGLAQVQLPPDTNLASVRLKLAYDLYYISHASLWLDFRILVSTAGKMAGMSFLAARRVFRLPIQDTIDREYNLLPLAPSLPPLARARTA